MLLTGETDRQTEQTQKQMLRQTQTKRQVGGGADKRTVFPRGLTSVIKEGFYKGAVLEGGADGGDVFKVTVVEGRVDEGHRLEPHGDEPVERTHSVIKDIKHHV